MLTPQPNDYAIITGATDGIGLEFAKQLAQRGYNLLLLSRRQEKLTSVAEQIAHQTIHPIEIDFLAVDFSRTDIYELIERKLDTLKGTIRILVNNVGVSHSSPEYFTEYPKGFHQQLINVNIVSLTSMSEMVLRIMCQNRKVKGQRSPRGIVINVSSLAGAYGGAPLMSTYSACK